jgi:hypothetical protein
MNLIGVTDELNSDAERQCAVGFRAWLVEARHGTWGNWEELVRQYPHLSRIDDNDAHIPLHEDGTGVWIRVFFAQQLMMLKRICKVPIRARLAQSGRFPKPMKQTPQPA